MPNYAQLCPANKRVVAEFLQNYRCINVAIAGLGKVGSQFLQALLSVNSENVKIIAVAEPRGRA